MDSNLIQIARECFADVEQDEGYCWQVTNAGLEKFAQRIRPQWLTIDSVPHFTRVLAWCNEANVKGVASEAKGVVLACYIPPTEILDGCFIDEFGGVMAWDFTHWMPLPKPPEGE